MNRQELKVVGASAVGTVFEWYDFFLYGALVPVIGSRFFSDYGTAAQTVFALLTFAAGFIVRPIGALVFARITDLVGRKIVFLMTLVLMGASTVAVGLLPTADEIGILAPILLVTCRILQGLAVSGEFGAAITHVSEYAPARQRAYFVGWLTGTTQAGERVRERGLARTRLADHRHDAPGLHRQVGAVHGGPAAPVRPVADA
ncbi:hypothetical protein Ssi02_44600 [Sinosporangium siamense]|uniref:Major facilitator superfamily (MFS) profile domain-containing protein n=1 Tax=Sinosporangium siamense TaxID=1367973 RepID=A0A919RKT7_9ACTN|nr:MFS transporter [Sinosporangium siamense]GII94229.1 hypothetical protein Ssi02_44600 [Sinosporangium siamense]